MMNLVQFSRKYETYIIGFALALLALVVNSFFAVKALGSIDLYFGSVCVLLSLLVLPARITVLVLIASIVPLLLFSSLTSFAWVVGAEYLVIAFLLYSGLRFLSALSIFWLIIGLPLTSLVIYGDSSLNLQTSIFLSFTIVLSAYICGLISLLVFWLLPAKSKHRQFHKPPKFAKLMFELNLISVMLPVFLVAIFFIWRSTLETEAFINLELQKAVQELDRSITSLFDNKIHALSAAALLIGREANIQQRAKILDTVANASANIESMVVVDENANVVLAAPERYAAILPDLSDINISHRDYFHRTKRTKQAVVSSAIEGRGFGSLDLVAITAPILQDGEFKGLVQAAIKLDNIVDLSLINAIQNSQINILITDAADKIVYSSPEFTFDKLDIFQAEKVERPFTFEMLEIDIAGKSFLYTKQIIQRGLKIYALTSPSRVFAETNTYFSFMSISILLSIVLIALLSKGLAAKITRPLRNLEAFIQGKKEADQLMVDAKVSQEMINVTENMIRTRALSQNFQRQLTQQVEEKTGELQALNKELLKVSQTDALTGLYNRGGFDELALKSYQYCQRHRKPFTLALFDIDHFKKINDSYGHTAGDVCIVDVANIITAKCRRDTDIVARYGGEEFVLFLGSEKPDQHLDHIEMIHKTIEMHHPRYNGKMIDLTVSCGVLRVERDFSKALIELISLADEQLYISKHKGRNQVNTVTL